MALSLCAEDFVTAGQLGQLLRVVPERERHTLELQWSVPSEVVAYRQAPCSYLSHLLGCAVSSLSLEKRSFTCFWRAA